MGSESSDGLQIGCKGEGENAFVEHVQLLSGETMTALKLRELMANSA